MKARDLIAGIGGSFRKHDDWAIRLVFFAGIITILHKAGVGHLSWSEVPPYAVVFAVSLGVAALLYEMNAARYALRHFWEGRAFGMLGWAFVWVVAFGYSMNQWVGAASESEGEKSRLQMSAFVQSSTTGDRLEVAKKALDGATERAKRLTDAGYDAFPLVDGVQMTSVSQAQAVADGKRNHRWFASYTDGCTKPRGKESQAFCDSYQSAVAAVAALKSRDEKGNEIKAQLPAALAVVEKARKEYAEALAERRNTKVVSDGQRNDLIVLTKYAGMSEADARIANALGSIIAISIFISLATMLKELEHLRATQPRVPLFRLPRWLARFFDMTEPDRMAPYASRRTEDDKPARLDQPALVATMGFVPPKPEPAHKSYGVRVTSVHDHLRALAKA